MLTAAYSVFLIALLASDTLRVTLDDCFRIAAEGSPQAVSAALDSVMAAGQWRSVAGQSLPQFRFSGQLPSLSEATNYQIVYDPASGMEDYRRVGKGEENWLGQIYLDQALPWGATASLSTRLYKTRWHDDRLRSGRDTLEYSFVRRAQLDQPILAGNPVGRQRAVGRLNWESSLAAYEMARRGIRYNITQAFFGLVSASGALAIAQQDLDQGRASEELSSRKLKAGMIPEVELLQIQVDLARREGSYRSTLSSLETARDRLRNQLGLPLNQPIEPMWEPGAATPVMPAGVDTAGETLDLKRQRLNLSRVELENRASRWQERVQATLQLYYEEDVRRRLTQDLDERGDRNRGVSLSLDLPLFGFGTTSGKVQELKARLRQARVEYTQSKAESAAELRQAVRQVELALDRIKIADAALELSQRSYEITTGRFDSGLVDARELLDAQISLTRTRTEALNARIDFELATANLERIAP